jgi:hypothetical protein
MFPVLAAETPQQHELTTLHPRISAFLTAWLAQRNAAQIGAFIDDSASKDKPVFGEGCGGWLRHGMSPENARRSVANYLLGSVSRYPEGTNVSQMLVNLSTAEWASDAINNVAADRYILMRVDSKSIQGMFGGKKNPYRDVLKRHLKNGSPIYWSVFGILLPDHDALVVYAAWQQVRDDWHITAIDVTCPGI